MNHNSIEKHPWVRFPEANGKIKNLIIGSFPPKKFTLKKENLSPGDVDFFYGSNHNGFWELFCEAMELGFFWRCDVDRLKSWLVDNQWGVTDIVLFATRNKNNSDSASDTDLRDKEYNTLVINDILENNPIEKIFFTSNWVFYRFNSLILTDRQHDFQLIQLISPSPNGLRRIDWAFNNLKLKLGESKSDYRLRYYQHFLK